MAKMKGISPADSAPNIPPWTAAKSPKWEIADEAPMAAYSIGMSPKCCKTKLPNTAVSCHPRQKSVRTLDADMETAAVGMCQQAGLPQIETGVPEGVARYWR